MAFCTKTGHTLLISIHLLLVQKSLRKTCTHANLFEVEMHMHFISQKLSGNSSSVYNEDSNKI